MSRVPSSSRIASYLEDEFLRELWIAIRHAGPIRSISVDLTRRCNLRCTGCYFFAEDLDQVIDAAETEFDQFIEKEAGCGTNFITVIGGEPSLELKRVRRLYDRFRLMVVTNGLRRIPFEGLEDLPIGVSVWSGQETDKKLRGYGKIDVFSKALVNYKDDERVIWYFTVTAGGGPEIVEVVEECVRNGNMVGFNYYGDLTGARGNLDHARGFDRPRRIIDDLIKRFPERIVLSSYINKVITTGDLLGHSWGHQVCSSISFDHPKNLQRVANGHPFNNHFRAYNADLASTRRCCVGDSRDCSTCFDVWAHMSWIMLNLRGHLRSLDDFTDWLTTTYLFYGVNRLISFEDFKRTLPKIHDRSAAGTAAWSRSLQ